MEDFIYQTVIMVYIKAQRTGICMLMSTYVKAMSKNHVASLTDLYNVLVTALEAQSENVSKWELN